MPEEGIEFQTGENLLTAEEIVRIIHVLADLGIKKIRFTGGEPLLHEDIIYLVSEAVATPGIESVHLTTNGLLLGKIGASLRQSGLHGINISLNTLDHEKYLLIARRDGLEKVLKNLSMVLTMSFPSVKLNVVVMKDFNHTEMGDFVALTKEDYLTVRFIELMPFDSQQMWRTNRFISAEKIVENLSRLYPNRLTVKGSATEEYLFQIPGYKGKFGVIPAYTRSLCRGCNRIRLTADGEIRNCLYSNNEFNLRKLIRNGSTHHEIASLFRQAMWVKRKDGYEADQQEGRHRESMTQIGG